MSMIRPPLPVKLFVGMLSSDPSLLSACAEALSGEFGPLDFQSSLIPWDHTDYYAHEMGPDLLRRFIFFEGTAAPDILPKVKHATARLEMEYAARRDDELRRRVNLDPGYVTEAKVVLATAKDFPHRVYIGSGVYAEATLRYSKDAHCFIPVEHTYPDFQSDQVRTLFCDARERLRAALVR